MWQFVMQALFVEVLGREQNKLISGEGRRYLIYLGQDCT